MRVVSGTRNHALPNGITIPAWELLPRPAAKQPSVPWTGVWLSDPTTTVPGRTKPLRTPTWWMLPLPQSNRWMPWRLANARFSSSTWACASVGGEK